MQVITNIETSGCSNCGNPANTYRELKDTCTDGLYGRPNVVDCRLRNNIKQSEWKNNGKIYTDGKIRRKYIRKHKELCKDTVWCPYYKGDFGECNKICGPGIKTRKVNCLKKDTCNKEEKPTSTQVCNTITCDKMCDSNYIYWDKTKDLEFKNCNIKEQSKVVKSGNNKYGISKKDCQTYSKINKYNFYEENNKSNPSTCYIDKTNNYNVYYNNNINNIKCDNNKLCIQYTNTDKNCYNNQYRPNKVQLNNLINYTINKLGKCKD